MEDLPNRSEIHVRVTWQGAMSTALSQNGVWSRGKGKRWIAREGVRQSNLHWAARQLSRKKHLVQAWQPEIKPTTYRGRVSFDPHAWSGTHTPPTHTLIKINFKTNRKLHIYTNFNLHVWYYTCNLHTHPCMLTSFINTQLQSCINADFLKTPPSDLSLRTSKVLVNIFSKKQEL